MLFVLTVLLFRDFLLNLKNAFTHSLQHEEEGSKKIVAHAILCLSIKTKNITERHKLKDETGQLLTKSFTPNCEFATAENLTFHPREFASDSFSALNQQLQL